MSTIEDDVSGEKGLDNCSHPTCNCSAQLGAEYCCEACRNSASRAESVCECGHPECGGPIS